MDDVPPGPTGPGPRRPALSVVIPVHNGGNDFECCLRRLRESRGADFEIIVVDDGSTDDSAGLAARFGAFTLTNPVAQGPASARNDGALAAGGDLVFFLDADIAVHPDALSRALARFEADPKLTALFGSYDDEPAAAGVVSRFRNLLHHFTHQQGAFVEDVRPARTFWTGLGVIRRQAFLDAGGFDPRLYTRPAIEDIELGYRLVRAGQKIVLARDVLGTHMKRWTLTNVVKTDIFQRGVPWMLLMKRSGEAETDLNVRTAQKLSVVATGLAILAAFASVWIPAAVSVLTLAPVLIVLMNLPFYRFLAKKRGILFATAALPLHLVYFACCGVSVIIALAYWHMVLRSTRTQPRLAGPMGLNRGPARRANVLRWIGSRRSAR